MRVSQIRIFERFVWFPATFIVLSKYFLHLDLDEVRIYVLHNLVTCIMLTDFIVSGGSVPALLFLQPCTACCRAPDSS